MGRYKSVEAKISIRDAVQDGLADLAELAEEMGSWRDNTEGTPAENSPRFEIVTETAEALESIDEPNLEDYIPTAILDREVTYHYSKVQSGRQKTPSRAVRCSNACAMIQAAVDELESDSLLDRYTDESKVEVTQQIEGLANELSEIISNVEVLEFPGMYS